MEKKVNYAPESSDEDEEEELYSSSKSKKKSAMSAPSASKSSRKTSTKVPPAKRMKKEVQSDSDSDDSSDEDHKASLKRKKPALKTKTKEADKKKASTKTKAKTKVKGKVKVKTEVVKLKAPKDLSCVERLEEARKAYKWWEAEELENGLMWRKLEHPGVLFAPPYVPHGVPLLYDGREVELTPAQEEVCSFYAAMPDDGPQLGNPKTRKVFQNNFMSDFKEVLPTGHVVKVFDKCDFSRITTHLDKQRSLKKAASLDEKAKGKAVKDDLVLRYGYALIDGRMEKVTEERHCVCWLGFVLHCIACLL
jgi:DNA topoisomerase I